MESQKEAVVFLENLDGKPVLEIHEIDLQTGEIEAFCMPFSREEIEQWHTDNNTNLTLRWEFNTAIREYAINHTEEWKSLS